MKLIATIALFTAVTGPVRAESVFDDPPADAEISTVPYASSLDEEQAAANAVAERAAYAEAQQGYLAAVVVSMSDRIDGLEDELSQVKSLAESQQQRLVEVTQALQERASADDEAQAQATEANDQATADAKVAAVQRRGTARPPSSPSAPSGDAPDDAADAGTVTPAE